jgi:hypothetical protein
MTGLVTPVVDVGAVEEGAIDVVCGTTGEDVTWELGGTGNNEGEEVSGLVR